MILLILFVAVGAGVYMLTVASLIWQDLVVGLVLSGALLTMFRSVLLPRPLPSTIRVLTAIVAFPLFAVMAVRDITKGTWQVALIVIGVRELEHPGIVRVPLGERSPASTGLAGFVITLSPGTFLVDVDPETNEMLVHAIDASDPDRIRRAYQTFYDRYERHVLP